MRRRQESLIDFARAVYPRFETAPHLQILAEALQDVESGKTDRLIVTMPPRHGKTWLASHLFPAWFLGRNPDKYVIAATYAQDLADDIGRAVRNIVADPAYQDIFPGVGLASDSASVRRFATTAGGLYFGVGAGGPVTGRGADLLLIDDPIKGREDADSEAYRRKLWDWYTSVAYTRLMPGGRVVLIQCLTGDAMVTMEDGGRKRIDSVRPGDRVLSWNGKEFVGNNVSTIIDNGPDQTYLIRTAKSEVRANARHPFLVLGEEGLRWTRVRDLKPGMRIVRHRAGHTRASNAPLTDVGGRRSVGECALPITGGRSGKRGTGRRLMAPRNGWRCVGSGDTGSAKRNSTGCSPIRVAFARSAERTGASGVPDIGSPTSSRITTTRQESFADCSATTATGSPDELAIPPFWNEPSNTSEIDTDEVISVDLGGVENVYDLTVDGDHNFIANGLVSHNTRWRADDLAGRVKEEQSHEGWETVDFPAILPSGKALWDERYPLETLERIKKSIPVRDWTALYMQRPTVDEGGILKRAWWKRWEKSEPPTIDHVLISIDGAYSTKDSADYSAITVWGFFRKPVAGDADRERGAHGLILLDAWRDRLEYPDFRSKVLAVIKDREPDTILIEDKASGQSLIQELRRAGIAVTAYKPDRDKVARAYSASNVMESGAVYVPEAPFAQMVIDECAAFPTGAHDDLVDTVTQAVLNFRQRGMLRLASDDTWDIPPPPPPRMPGKSYYA